MKDLLQLIRDIIDEFTDILKEILMPRTFFAFMFYAVFLYLIVVEKTVPDALQSIVTMLMGYWFGSRVGDKVLTKENSNEQSPKVSV